MSLAAQNIIRCCSTPCHVLMSLIISVQDGIMWAQKSSCTPPHLLDISPVLPSKQFSSLIGRRGAHPHQRKDHQQDCGRPRLRPAVTLDIVLFCTPDPTVLQRCTPTSEERHQQDCGRPQLRPAVTLDIGLFCTQAPTVLQRCTPTSEERHQQDRGRPQASSYT